MDSSPEKAPENAPQGLSFQEAANSTVTVWQKRLEDENYPGDAKKAAQLLTIFCQGINYSYNTLRKRNKVAPTTVLPRVDFDDLSKSYGIVYLARIHTIVVPTHWLKVFEPHKLVKYVTLTDSHDNQTIEFDGEIRELWFLSGVEEMVHALDPKKPQNAILPSANVSTAEYHAQPHEYKALGWQVRAAIDNKFSQESIDSSKSLLEKSIKYRAYLKQNNS